MADENTPDVEGQPEGDEDISWEDAFREMAEAQQGDEGDPDEGPVHEAAPPPPPEPAPAAASSPQPSSTAVAQALDSQGEVDIEFLLDIALDVTVEVGRCKMLVNELLQLQQGSVIPLEKMVGEPFEVYVNRKLMAFGEVVVVNEKFGIRLTDIIDPKERIQQLA